MSTLRKAIWLITAIGVCLQSVCAYGQIGRMHAIAANAKDRGKSAVTIQSPGPISAVYDTLGSLLRDASPVVVTIKSKTVALSPDENSILTWYVATLDSNVAHLSFTQELPALRPPSTVSVPSASVLIVNRGGTLSVDGVTVTTNELPVTLQINTSYLLFVRFLDLHGDRTRVGNIQGGIDGVYIVNVNGHSFKPLGHQRLSYLMIADTHGSLQQLTGLVHAILAKEK